MVLLNELIPKHSLELIPIVTGLHKKKKRKKKKKPSFVFSTMKGTIWCGAGNKANNDTERLGAHNETDACCREHDLNSDYIAAGQIAHDYGNIHNKYSFTMLVFCNLAICQKQT